MILSTINPLKSFILYFVISLFISLINGRASQPAARKKYVCHTHEQWSGAEEVGGVKIA